jgi:uncharacterized damage-inducible protein DinB
MSVFTNPASASAENAAAYTAAILGLVGDRDPMAILRATPAALDTAIHGLSERQLRTPEAPGKWSIRHLLQHLADSEIVYAWRLRLVLAHDRPRLEGYDQDLWAERLGYDQADPMQALHDFSVLRAANLRLLARATPEDLERLGVHDERGPETVAHLMRLYAGHDLMHLQQLERIRATLS